jgi:uncharacterized membrane protein
MGDRTAGGVAAACPGWMKLLLILSLAANVVIAGVVIGYSFHDQPERGSERVINWIIEMVPDERRDLARAHFAGTREQIETARAERITHLPAVVAAMQAEPFDPAALGQALETMFDRRNSGRAILREHLITLLGQLTPAERAAFAARFEERLTERAERRGD